MASITLAWRGRLINLEGSWAKAWIEHQYEMADLMRVHEVREALK